MYDSLSHKHLFLAEVERNQIRSQDLETSTHLFCTKIFGFILINQGQRQHINVNFFDRKIPSF